MCTKVFLFLLLAFCPLAFGQETRSLPGMQEAMAEMVKGKYRSREASASPWQNEILVTSAHIDAVIENEICTNNVFDTKFVKQFNVQSPICTIGINDKFSIYCGNYKYLLEEQVKNQVK